MKKPLFILILVLSLLLLICFAFSFYVELRLFLSDYSAYNSFIVAGYEKEEWLIERYLMPTIDRFLNMVSSFLLFVAVAVFDYFVLFKNDFKYTYEQFKKNKKEKQKQKNQAKIDKLQSQINQIEKD